jgi:hypothetical protein
MHQSDNVARYAASWVFPFLQSQLPDGYVVRPVPDNIQIQHRYGDKWLASSKHQHAIEVELKSESKHTGNLFIETWSDIRNGVHGWLYHYADETRLAYAFNDSHTLYTCEIGELRKWSHGEGFQAAIRIEDFRHVEQQKYQQRNVTVGRLVPVEVFLCEVPGARVHECQEVACGTNP